jgi:hypothetical protein
MRRSWTLLAASFAVILTTGAAARADGSRTEWDETERRPPVDRPSEYRMPDTDNWINLTPTVAGFMPDGGLKINGAPMLGLKLGLEPASVLELSFGFLASLPASDWGARVVGTSAGVDQTSDVKGELVQGFVNLALRNPELQFGIVQFWVGASFNAFYMSGYSGNVTSGGQPARATFKDTTMLAIGPFPRMDLNFSDNFRLEVSLNILFPFYAMGTSVGSLQEKKASFQHMVWEPVVGFAFRF